MSGPLVSVVAASQALIDAHEAWAWVVIVTNGLAGAWALGAHRVEALRVKPLWWFTLVAEVAVFVQVILGVVLVQGREDLEPLQFHMLYGFGSAFAVAIIYSYRNQLKPHRYLLYGFGGLFLMGMGLRSVVVGVG